MSHSSSLKVNKTSRVISKPSKPSSSNISSSSHPKWQKPLIIYTYSPKVIRTTPDKFKSLVQKLTGRERTSLPDLNENGGEIQSSEDERLAATENKNYSTQLLNSAMDESAVCSDPLGFDYYSALLYRDFIGRF